MSKWGKPPWQIPNGLNIDINMHVLAEGLAVNLIIQF